MAFRIVENKSNVGWKENLKRGQVLCSDDNVFSCDQDDVWGINRIEAYDEVVASNPSVNIISILFCRFECVPEDSKRGWRGTCRYMPSRTLNECRASHGAGCTMAVRKTNIDLIAPFYPAGVAHDYLYRQAALFDGTSGVMDDAPIGRSAHDANASENVTLGIVEVSGKDGAPRISIRGGRGCRSQGARTGQGQGGLSHRRQLRRDKGHPRVPQDGWSEHTGEHV
jgi:hypothetical protein